MHIFSLSGCIDINIDKDVHVHVDIDIDLNIVGWMNGRKEERKKKGR